MKFFVHPGPGKTGSTSLQKFIAENNSDFLELGYFCPMDYVTGNANARSLVSDLRMNPPSEDFVSLGYKEAIAEWKATCDKENLCKIFLSSEFFSASARSIVL